MEKMLFSEMLHDILKKLECWLSLTRNKRSVDVKVKLCKEKSHQTDVDWTLQFLFNKDCIIVFFFFFNVLFPPSSFKCLHFINKMYKVI